MNKKKISPISPIVTRSSWSGGWATLRDLEVIKTVIDSGSVTSAAEKLGISQPAVSRALSQIETRSKKTLFTRENNRLIPNADARLLYAEIALIAESFERLNAFKSDNKPQQLRIIVPPTIAYGFINKITALYARENPQTHIHLEIARSDSLLPIISKNEADVAIAVADAVSDNQVFNLQQFPIRKTAFICALPKSHPLCHKHEICPEDLHDQPFIALIKHNIGRALIDRTLNKAGSKPMQVAEVSDLETALIFVENGLGLSVICAFPMVEHKDIEYRPYSPGLNSVISCFAQKNINSHTQNYIDFIKKNLPQDDNFSLPN